MPASNTGVSPVRPELSGSAAGLDGALIVAGGAVMTAVTGNLVTESDGAKTLLLLMLAVCIAGLGFALWGAWLKREQTAKI